MKQPSDLENIISPLISERRTEHSWHALGHIHSLTQGYGNYSILCHNIVQRRLGPLNIQSITLIYSTDDNILIRPDD